METQVSQEELLRQLSFIEDPGKQLQEMIKRGLLDQADKKLRDLVASTDRIYFQHPSRINGAVCIGKGKSSSKYIVCVGNQLVGRTDFPSFAFDPKGLQRLFGWTDQQLNEFMQSVFVRVMGVVSPDRVEECIASWAGSWEVNAFYLAMNDLVPEDHDLRSQLELWQLRAVFFTGDYFLVKMPEQWRNDVLGCEIKENPYSYRHWLNAHGTLQRMTGMAEAVIERMRVLGMSDDQIREDCYTWLDQYAQRISASLLVGVANASVFEWADQRRAEIMKPIAVYVTKLMLDGNRNAQPQVVARLIEGGMLQSAEGRACAAYKEHAAQSLSEGRIGLVSEVTAMVGACYFEEEEPWGPDPKLKFSLEECAARAFDLAWEKGEHGIAAALVNQFGPEACFDKKVLRDRLPEIMKREPDGQSKKEKLKELVAERKAQIKNVCDLAKTMGKPARLDYSPGFAPKLND